MQYHFRIQIYQIQHYSNLFDYDLYEVHSTPTVQQLRSGYFPLFLNLNHQWRNVVELVRTYYFMNHMDMHTHTIKNSKYNAMLLLLSNINYNVMFLSFLRLLNKLLFLTIALFLYIIYL